MASIKEIEGISTSRAEKFKKAGIRTTEQLLEKCDSKVARLEVARQIGMDEKKLLRFVNHADLMRVKGVGGEFAELLEAAGVDSVPELAKRNASNLRDKMEEVNEKEKLVRQVPSVTMIEGWIKAAKETARAVAH